MDSVLSGLNQLDICALLFRGYSSLIPLDKWYYMVGGNLPSDSSLMSQLALTLFLLCDGLLLYFLKVSSYNNYNSDSLMCVFLLLTQGLKQYHISEPSLLEKILNELSCDVSL